MKPHSLLFNKRLISFQLSWIIVAGISPAIAQTIPSIQSFSPSSAVKNEIVTINGSNFSNTLLNNTVYFGAGKGTVISATTNRLDVVVPANATFDPIAVTVNGYTAYTEIPFIPTFLNGRPLDATTFSSSTNFITSTQPLGIAISDFDGDTKTDISVVNSLSNTVSVLKNITTLNESLTSSSLAVKLDYTSGSFPSHIAVGDLDSDGKPDLVVANRNSNTISIFRNTSATGAINFASFAGKVDLATGSQPNCIAIQDLNLDGKPDIAVTNYSDNTFSVFRNISSPGSLSSSSFAAKIDFITGSHPTAIAIANLDTDNKPDVVVVNSGDNSVSPFENTSNESITFDDSETLTAGDNPTSLAIGDLDDDGRPEIVVSNFDGNSISVFRKKASSLSSNPYENKIDFITDPSPHTVALSDLDGDGNVDIAVSCSGSGTDGKINLFKNLPVSGKFDASSLSAKISLSAGTYPTGLAIGDINGDGKPEMIISNRDNNTISVYQNMTSPAPFISEVLPDRGALGSTITITGSNFSITPSQNIVRFNGARATVLSSSTSTVVVIVPPGATDGPVTITVNDQTATSPANFYVCLHTISIISAEPSICSGLATTLVASGANSYAWSPATGLSSTSGSSVQANPGTTTTYTVTGTFANGCTSSTTVTVGVKPRPVITVSPSTEICEGSSVTLVATGGTQYTWAPSPGLSASTGNLVQAAPDGTTTYTVTGAGANGCTNTATVTVTVKNKPVINVSRSMEVCAGSSVALGASGANTYSWSPVTGLSKASGNAVEAAPAGTTTYTVTGTSANGCSNSRTVTVTVKNRPEVLVSPSGEICVGSSFPLGASGASSYIWSPASGLSATTGNSVQAKPNATTTYTVTGTGANGCTSTGIVTVSVKDRPKLTVSPDAEICMGSATLTVAGANTYSWSPITGLSSATGNTVQANPSATTTYTVTGTSTNGCTNTGTVTVTVSRPRTITVSPDIDICAGASTTLTASGATSYQWHPMTGLSSTTGSATQASPESTVTYTVTGVSPGNCTNSATVTVNVKNRPMITVDPLISVCSGSSTVLTANGATAYFWTPSNGLSATSGSSVSANPAITTTYTVTGTTDNCTGSATTTVKIIEVPKPEITLSPPSHAGTYTLTSSSASGNQWYKDGLAINGATNQIYVADLSGNYSVRVREGDCISALSDAVSLIVTTIDHDIKNADVRLFPNPAIDVLYIDWVGFDENIYIDVCITDMVGKKAITRRMTSEETLLDISALHHGHFILQAKQKSRVFSQRFAKK